MKEHGFIFSAEMVRALLDGSKTQTRRGITRQRSVDLADVEKGVAHMPSRGLWDILDWSTARAGGAIVHVTTTHGHEAKLACRVRKGDRIWVRETWRVFGYSGPPGTPCVSLQYRAEGKLRNVVVCGHEGKWPQATTVWRSPLHMPRWGSRILLEVTDDPWPQQIGDITEEQCIAEGVEYLSHEPPFPCWRGAPDLPFEATALYAFEGLWQSINGAWDLSAWVWVYEFRRIGP